MKITYCNFLKFLLIMNSLIFSYEILKVKHSRPLFFFRSFTFSRTLKHFLGHHESVSQCKGRCNDSRCRHLVRLLVVVDRNDVVGDRHATYQVGFAMHRKS